MFSDIRTGWLLVHWRACVRETVWPGFKAMRAKFQYFLKVGLWTWHPLTTHVCSFNFFPASRITSFWRKALIPGYCPFLDIVESWNFGHHYQSASCICSVQVWFYSYSHNSSFRYKNCRRKAYLVLFEPVCSSDSNGGIFVVIGHCYDKK